MSESTEVRHDDGRVELRDPDALKASPLYNEDLAPVSVAHRNWNTWDYAALWISMAHCIPTYMLASGMIASGMAWWQALLTILAGNLIVLAPILLNSHPGTKYGIPFPVFARAAYGTSGANLPALMRALIACGWFGINCWYGGEALQVFIKSLWPGWGDLLGIGTYPRAGFENTMWISFLLFWVIDVIVIFKGMELVRRIERFAAPFVLVMTTILVGWMIHKAGGLGPILSQTSFVPAQEGMTLMGVMIPALTSTIAFWSTLSLNMPDFTRYGKSQREQAIGQTVALPSTMTVFAAMGIMITSAAAVSYDEKIWSPMTLVSLFDNRWVVGISTFTIVIATLAVNIAANVVSPANDFANAFPKKINFQRGGLITGLIGIAMVPWELVKDPVRYMNGWLGGYGAALGSIAGVLIVDYWVIRNKELDLRSLYVGDGAYRYTNGWNLPAVYATVLGAGVALAGAFWEPMKPIYDWSWFVGFGLAAGLYYALMRGKRPV
jgi:nucleobase:cation symporter-1, NCS1 family